MNPIPKNPSMCKRLDVITSVEGWLWGGPNTEKKATMGRVKNQMQPPAVRSPNVKLD